MDVLYARCAGIDVSKADAKVCVRVQGAGGRGPRLTTTTWGSMTNQVLALRDYLAEQQVTCVVMESTGDYWKPFYYVLETLTADGVELVLTNARDVKNLPGRKTDVSDAAWLAQLGAHGLVRASFVPPEPIRQLRDLTRARTILTHDRSREVQRLEKVLEDAGIKLSLVASDIMGASGRAMLARLIAGERDPAVLAGLAKGVMRKKTDLLTSALVGRFTAHHGFLVDMHLRMIDHQTTAIEELTTRIEEAMLPFLSLRDLLTSIPGISTRIADVVIAETGGDMARFPTAGHLASWAGVCPGHHQSAGRVKSSRTRPGDHYLKGALGLAALSIARNQTKSFLGAKYRRLVKRRGKLRSLVALEHTLLVTIWTMITNGTYYTDLGTDFHQRRHPERTQRQAIHQLQQLGWQVTLTRAS